MFIWPEKDLNKQQEDAIHEDGSVLLIACPGSGKTRTLTYKIAWELSRLQSSKGFIVAITYTNAAAEEIKERIEKLGVGIQRLWIGTIHSFCLEWILRPYSLYVEELRNGFTILNSPDSEEILTELCKPYKRNPRITYYDCGFFATIRGFTISSLDDDKEPYIHKVLDDYFEILKTNRQIDYEQILSFAYQLLKAKPVICSLLANLFPFILIDEYQDTKEIQYHIIFSILRAGSTKSKTLIVGDPNQSIYDTLGGYPMKQPDMEKLLGFPLKEYQLTGNYRSSARIITYFDAFKTFPNSIVAKGSLADYASVITYNHTVNHEDLEDEIVRLLVHNIEGKGISPNQICIAGPQWIPLAGLTRRLMVKLPDYSFDGPGMAPFSRDIDNFWFKLSRILLTESSPDLYVRRLRWAGEILTDLFNMGADISALNNKLLLKICNTVIPEESEGLRFLAAAFVEIFAVLKINIELFQTLREHRESFFKSSHTRIERLKKEGNEFIDSIVNFKKVFRQKEGIKISTIHGVKGTEYDTVIGFGLLEGWVPHFSDSNGAVNSQKMLYVLSSRARKNLHLFSETGRDIRDWDPQGKLPTAHLLSYQFNYDTED